MIEAANLANPQARAKVVLERHGPEAVAHERACLHSPFV